MRVLITGAQGFVGGRLTKQLASRGSHDLLLGSRRPQASAYAAAAVTTRWDEPAALQQLCRNVDVIVHLAGMNAKACADDPTAAHQVNGLNTANLVRAAGRAGVVRFIFLSTAHVYASPLQGTITERTRPVSRHPYATSKRVGEDAVFDAHARGTLEGVVVRLSNGFGAPADTDADCWDLIVNDICRQAASQGAMELRSTGLERRDFVPMTEVCRALEYLLDPSVLLPERGVVNLGGRWAPTVWEMARRVQQRCGVVLGVPPPLCRPGPAPGDVRPTLDYRIDALLETGYVPAPDVDGEIDGLLSFCAAAFR
jgi:UDP-glucose 4-epimerase